MRSATDRGMQRRALEDLAQTFPQRAKAQTLFPGEPMENVAAVLAYLEQHGLVEVVWTRPLSGPAQPVGVVITAQGIDFIADDGGLSAILGVVTVKLHDDTVRDLLVRAVSEAETDVGVKTSLIAQLKALPAEGLKEATMGLAKAGLAATPAAIAWLRGKYGV